MARGRKKVTLEQQLEDVSKEILKTEECLKGLRQKKKEISDKIQEDKKQQLYEAVMKSGKSIDEFINELEQ